MSCAWRMSPSIQHQSVMIDHDPIQQQPSHQAGQARLNDGRSRTDSHGSCLVVSVCLKGTWREPIERLLKLEWDELVDHAGEDSRSIRKYSTKCRAADRDDGRLCSAMVRDTFEWSLQWILATISWPWSSLSASPRPRVSLTNCWSRPSSAGWASVASRSRTWSNGLERSIPCGGVRRVLPKVDCTEIRRDFPRATSSLISQSSGYDSSHTHTHTRKSSLTVQQNTVFGILKCRRTVKELTDGFGSGWHDAHCSRLWTAVHWAVTGLRADPMLARGHWRPHVWRFDRDVEHGGVREQPPASVRA